MRRWPVLALFLTASFAIAQHPELKERPATPRVPASEVEESQRIQAAAEAKESGAVDDTADVSEQAEILKREGKIVVPAGTKVPVALRSAVSTKTAHEGDGVYAQTTFPVAINDRMVIPAGTYVQGKIMKVVRPGRIKGRAEILFLFTSLVFPSGYTVSLPGSVNNTDSESGTVKDKEGTIRRDGEKGKDAQTIGATAASGAVIGGLANRGVKGVGIGGGVGAAAGTAIALLSRGSDMRLEAGSTVEMILQRDLILDESRVRSARFRY